MKKMCKWVLMLCLCLCLATAGSTAQAESSKLTLSATHTTIFTDQTVLIEPESSDPALSLEGLTYAVKSKKLAEIDEHGLLLPLGTPGQVTVTATTADGKHTATLKISIVLRPDSVSVKGSDSPLKIGKSMTLRAAVLPKTISNQNVTWSSSDEAIATVDKNGRVTALSPGQVIITAASVRDPMVCGQFTVACIRPATRLELTPASATILVRQTTALTPQFTPADTTNKKLTFSSVNPKIATVDEAGLVTGLKAGKATIRAKTTDGSNKTATVQIIVQQPVEGVHFDKDSHRLAVGYTLRVEAILEPKDASNKHMTWTSSDESIATVTGNTNVSRVVAHAWGEATITGVTEDGGYSASYTLHGGAYRFALRVVRCRISDRGKPLLIFENVSNLNIAEVRYQIRGTDANGEKVVMNTRGDDEYTLFGTYEEELAPGDRTEHGLFSFRHPSTFPGMTECSVAITGFTTDDDFTYNIVEDHWKWVSSDDQ